MARLHPADQLIYQDRFGTEEMRAIWDEENLLKKRLEVEVALAKVQARLGIIPQEAAQEIEKKLTIENITVEETAVFKTGSDIVAMIKAAERTLGDTAELMHYGLTSQDVLETSLALLLKDTWKIIVRDLRELEEVILELAGKYKKSPQAGRPHGQFGTVITFGFKTAIWATEIRRHIERLKEMRKRLFVGNLSGSHGTFAPLKGRGLEVQQETLRSLNLEIPDICTHQSRDRFQEFMNALALIGVTLERITKTCFELHRPEIFELESAFVEGQQVDSSTMPHRRGPGGVDWIWGFVKILRGNALAWMEVTVEDERTADRLPLEHAALPESCLLVAASLKFVIRFLKNMKVHPENMEASLLKEPEGRGVGGPFIMGESLFYAVAEKTGKKQSAHKMIYRIAQKAFKERIPFRQALVNDDELRQWLSEKEIDDALNPHKYLGEAPIVVDNVIAKARSERAAEEKLII